MPQTPHNQKRCQSRSLLTRLQCALPEGHRGNHYLICPTGVPWDPGPAGDFERSKLGYVSPDVHLPSPYVPVDAYLADGTERVASWFGDYWAEKEDGEPLTVLGWKLPKKQPRANAELDGLQEHIQQLESENALLKKRLDALLKAILHGGCGEGWSFNMTEALRVDAKMAKR